MRKLFVISFFASLIYVRSYSSRVFRTFRVSYRMSASVDVNSNFNSILPEPYPGNPVVKKIDKESNIASMSVALSGEKTQRAFQQSCELFNAEVKKKNYQVPGYRKGANLPPAFLFQIFGEEQVKNFCATLLSEDIQDECEKTGLMFVGRGRIINFYQEQFTPGKPHTLDIECDLWPDITYTGPDGYKGLTVTVVRGTYDTEKFEKVSFEFQCRACSHLPTPSAPGFFMANLIETCPIFIIVD